MFTSLEENSVLHIALVEWVPPLITIVVGGLIASVLIPRWQDAHARHHAREARRLALAEELARNFLRYVISWERLLIIAELEAERPEGLSDEEQARKISYVVRRQRP